RVSIDARITGVSFGDHCRTDDRLLSSVRTGGWYRVTSGWTDDERRSSSQGESVLLQQRTRGGVFLLALGLAIAGQTAGGVHVVLEVGDLDAARQRVGGDARDHLVVSFALAAGERLDGVAGFGAVARGAEIVDGGFGNFHHLGPYADDARRPGLLRPPYAHDRHRV